MDTSSKDAVPKDKGRKFLPEWMIQNIERLSIATDLDEYACTTLEAEGYFPECATETSTGDSMTSPVIGTIAESVKTESVTKATPEDSNVSSSFKLSIPTNEMKMNHSVSPKHLSVVDAIKCEGFYSSPDSTPCVTPEQSPIPQRKKSFSQDTVESNPQKWFYLGIAKNAVKPKQLRKKCLQNTSSSDQAITEKTDKNLKEVHSRNNGVKLTISNFDLNAISPSSW